MVPYSKWYVVASPRVFTVPFSVATVCPIAVACSSSTRGGTRDPVVNSSSSLCVVPSSLVATSRKW